MWKKLKIKFLKFFYAQNFAYCRSSAYLASQRGESVVAGEWDNKAQEWELLWWKADRSLR